MGFMIVEGTGHEASRVGKGGMLLPFGDVLGIVTDAARSGGPSSMLLTRLSAETKPAWLSDMTSPKRVERPSPKLTSPTIFHEHWWLDIATGGAFREAVVSSGGSVVGRLPYLAIRKRSGFTVLRMPLMTHVLGPAFYAGSGVGLPNASKQMSITRELIGQLPPALHASFRLHGGVTDTLAFDVEGFCNGVGYTVELPPRPHEAMWRDMRDKTRNVIRRAEERLTVIESLDIERFLSLYDDNLRDRNESNAYDRRICAGIIGESLRRGVGRVLAVTDPAGKVQAAIFTVWDSRSEYYFMSTRTQTSLNGAISLCIWTAIQHAARNGLTFDMDGLHVKDSRVSNLTLLTGFGGVIKPRYVVRRTSSLLNIARQARRLVIG